MPSRITAIFEVVTPLFLGGADPARTVELRPPSIKGALRFWWRALAWNRHGGDLSAIQKEEQEIFGAAGQEGAAAGGAMGQASFILRIPPIKGLRVISKGEVLGAKGGAAIGPGMRYFGYGLMEAFGQNAGRLTRRCLSAPFQFSIEFVSRRPFDDSMIDALKVTGLLGGLGGRSRRGYGSLSIVSLAGDVDAWSPPKTKADFAGCLRTIVQPNAVNAAEPPYSAFSGLSRVLVVAEGNEPLALLDSVGKQMQRYRSWGHNGKVNNEASERNFQDDHDWFKNGAIPKTKHPKRVVFGLPHNYSKAVGIVSQQHERRASPLAVHIHKLESEYVAVISILRSSFLADGDKLLVRNGSAETPCEPQIDWAVLNGFVDGTNKKTNQPYFPNCTPILP